MTPAPIRVGWLRSRFHTSVEMPSVRIGNHSSLVVPTFGVLLFGCVTQDSDPRSTQLSRDVKTYTEDDLTLHRVAPPWAGDKEESNFPPGLVGPSQGNTANDEIAPRSLAPYHAFTHQTLQAPDGRLTRLYWVRAGMGAILDPLIKAHTRAGDAAVATVTVTPGAQVDPRPAKTFKEIAALANQIPGVEKVSDLIAVTSNDNVLLEVDAFLSALLTEVPQVEIEATVVEITYDDDVDVGSNLTVTELADRSVTNPDGTIKKLDKGNDRSTLFSQLTSPLDPDAFLAGNQIGSLSLAFFENDLRYRAILRAVQTSSNAEVLSSPKMAVLNGHRAVIDTGTRQPVLQPVLGNNGNLTQVQVRFEDTGIKLVVIPYVLMDDIIQVDITAEVSFVSGFIETGQTGILNPIISERTASTVINVRDGQPFAIGGLKLTNKIERTTKIPVLGDIPVLGYLFKTESLTDRQSKVLFLVKPTLFRQPPPLFDPGR